MPKLELSLLGPPRLELEGQLVEPDTRKAVALLAYLALAGERLSRDALAAFLWPEFDDRRAKAALRRTLSALKTTVGDAPLYAAREHIGVESNHLWCDVIAFQQAISAARDHDHAAEPLCPACQAELETAVSLYRDDFMSGFSLRDSIPFDDWQLQQAEVLRRDLAGALERLVCSASGRHDFEAAIARARRWLQLDPLREEAHCQLMRLYAWSGQRSAALLQYRECVRILDEELGVPPLPETTALYDDIQRDRLTMPPLEVQQRQGGPGIGLAVPSAGLPAVPSAAYPLVGRDADLELLRQFYRQVGPDGRLLIIEGEPGIGKTRLAQTLLAWAAETGSVILSGHCYQGESNLAYAPIIQALQDGLDRMDAAWVDALPARHVAEAARLLPQLADDRALPALPTLASPGAQVRFYDGVVHLLMALLGGSAPGILWLDDAHWLDSASQELLLYLLHRWQSRPLLVLLCWQAEELSPDNPLLALAATLRRAGAGETIRLARFTAAQVEDLLSAASLDLPPDMPERLFNETEGLPFFLVEYLNALERHDGAVTLETALPTPASVRDLLLNRLAQVTETERQVLQAAAAIGHGFELGLVQAASGRSVEESVVALERLAERGLLAEHTAIYDFSHDKLRALVYEEMGLARRRLLHRRLAETLAGRRVAPTPAASAQIASHYQLAGLETEAAVHYVQAGDRAKALYAHQDAIHYYRSALALGAADAWRLHAACGELSMRLGRYPDALSSYETAAALAPASELARLEHQLAEVYQRRGNWSLAAHMLAQAQEHLGDTADPPMLIQLAIDRSLVAHRLAAHGRQQPEEALALAQQARDLAEGAADPSMLAQAYNLQGMLARSQGKFSAAVTLLERSRQLADSGGRLDVQIAARNNLALALSAAGELAEARANLEQALALCQRLGDRHHEAALRSNLADVLHQSGEETAAQEQIRQSVAIYADIGREANRWHADIWKLTEW